jgi:hypothetical protein
VDITKWRTHFGRKNRVVLGLVELGGFYANLKAGLQELGVDVRHYVVAPHRFQYAEPDRCLVITWVARSQMRRSKTSKRQLPLKLITVVENVLARIVATFWLICRFDTVIFAGGVSLLGGADLWLMKVSRMTIVIVFHGSDERPPYINAALCGKPESFSPIECARLARSIKKRVRRSDRFATWVIGNPASAHFHERPIICILAIGLPCDVSKTMPRRTQSHDEIRILHAPSNASIKGTVDIRKCVDTLTSEGFEIEFTEISDRSNQEVQLAMQRCDLVIDEVWSDSPMGMIGGEAASAWKPYLAGGYAWPFLERITPKEWIPPVALCEPEYMLETVRQLVSRPRELVQLGAKAHEFVAENWDRRIVATKMLELVRNGPRPDWLFDPREITYIEGYGLPRDRACKIIRELVNKLGPEALLLEDKPALRDLFVNESHI